MSGVAAALTEDQREQLENDLERMRNEEVEQAQRNVADTVGEDADDDLEWLENPQRREASDVELTDENRDRIRELAQSANDAEPGSPEQEQAREELVAELQVMGYSESEAEAFAMRPQIREVAEKLEQAIVEGTSVTESATALSDMVREYSELLPEAGVDAPSPRADAAALADDIRDIVTMGDAIAALGDPDAEAVPPGEEGSTDGSSGDGGAAPVPGDGFFAWGDFEGDINIYTFPTVPRGPLFFARPGVAFRWGESFDCTCGVAWADVAELPILSGPVASQPTVGTQDPTIVLRNPVANGSAIGYLLNNQTFQMQSGYEQRLPDGRTWTIQLDRGGDFGTVMFSLEDGYYDFLVTERGWDIVRRTFVSTIDNQANAHDFNLLLNGSVVTIAAGHKYEAKSSMPIRVVFDNGNGESIERMLADKGSYVVGVTSANEFDLFDASQARIAPLPSELVEQLPAPVPSAREVAGAPGQEAIPGAVAVEGPKPGNADEVTPSQAGEPSTVAEAAKEEGASSSEAQTLTPHVERETREAFRLR